MISQHDPKAIYCGGNVLFKSPDRGDNWTTASPDLTTGIDRKTLANMGKAPDKGTLSRIHGVQQYPSITTDSESPLNAQALWVGTEDGVPYVTTGGGGGARPGNSRRMTIDEQRSYAGFAG